MIRPLGALLAVALLPSGAAFGQRITTYTQNQTAIDRVALGYPVPMPVASLTPVDGFRDYASLDARLRQLDEASADLRGHDVGQTRNGRTERAYVVSDADTQDVEGRAEAAFFINAATHAREWAAPEVSTHLVERMVAGADDGGLVRYLLDNTRLVIIPVHNIDGFQQAQRFPDQVIIGQDPRFPTVWPRDGRMRRKNMPGVDENLATLADHLGGVDLNRNHPPFWGTTTQGGQLTNPNDLTYRGTAAHSEPENQALVAAAALGPASRMRLGIDVHTFSRVFFSSNTGRTRLNQIQTRLFNSIAQHHRDVPTAAGTPNGAFYEDVRDPANAGIGVAAEYFSYQWLVPGMTLELEPRNGSEEYGGFAVSHSGFILPESQIRRVREAWAESFLTAFYFMSGPPHLKRIRYLDAHTDEVLRQQQWIFNPANGRRELVISGEGALFPGRVLRIELSFNKPMRYRDASGVVRALPGHNSVLTAPTVRLIESAGERSIPTASGSWLGDQGALRYRDDTFAFEYIIDSTEPIKLSVQISDMVDLALDANPATPVDWADGAWSAWEDANGVAGDTGGADRSTAALALSALGDGADLSLVSTPTVVGEGDGLRMIWRRAEGPAQLPVELQGAFSGGPTSSVSWAAGETGLKTLLLRAPEDVTAQGDRPLQYSVRVAGAGSDLASGSAQVLDNDREGRSVVRVADDLAGGLTLHASGAAAQRDVVLDGGRDYPAPESMLAVCQPFEIEAPITLYGNRASLSPTGDSCFGPKVSGNGTAWLRDLTVLGSGGGSVRTTGIDAGVSLLNLVRVRIDGVRAPAVKSVERIQLQQSVVFGTDEQGDFSPPLIDAAQAQVLASSIIDNNPLAAVFKLGQGDSSLRYSTLYRNAENLIVPGFESGALVARANVLHETDDGIEFSPPILPACSGMSDLGLNFYTAAGGGCGFSNSGPLELGARRETVGYFPPNAQLIDQGGSDCGPVDQRGAPRPQTRTPNATPLCDIGAIEDGINPWRGLWIPDRPGHGIDMQTAGNVLFLLWYTYGDDGKPVAYQAAAPLTGPRWSADLLLASRNPANGTITNTRVGTLRIDFSSDVAATLTWRFDARGTEGSEGLTAYAFANGEPRVETTGTWYPPAESGYGASLTRRGEITAMALYYYDAQGKQRWMLGAGDAQDVVEFQLESFTGFCPDCSATANPVQSQPAGSARVHFLTPDRARVSMDVTYPGIEGGRWQRSNADFIPLNDPADNREADAALQRR